jgi:DNA-binding MarR family transcriptional regulator
LQLTPAGRDAIEGLIPVVVEKLNLVLADFSRAEFQEFQRLLIKFNTRLQSIVEQRVSPASAHG